MKATGFFHSASSEAIVADARDDVARQLAEASSGWNAVAVGAARRPGLALRQDRSRTRSVMRSAIAPSATAIVM
jgi:adenylate cyclase